MAARAFEGSIAYSCRSAVVMAFLFIAMLSSDAFTQCAPTPTCPAISVDGPSGIPTPGEPIRFRLSGEPDRNTFEYTWTLVSAGEIVSGQGTHEVLVLPEDLYKPITAKLEARHRFLGCITSDMATMNVHPPPLPRKLVLDLPKISKMTDAQLQKAASSINADPTATLFVVFGAVNERRAASTEKLLRSKLTSLIKSAKQLFMVRSGLRSERTTFWLVPAGATPPRPDHQ